MLKVFRDNLKYLSWVLWVVIAVFVLFVFVDFGGVSSGLRGAAGDAAATVGGESVTYDQVRREYRDLENYYRQTFGEAFTPELAQQFGVGRQALERVVNRVVMLGEARRLGLAVGEGELRAEIHELFADEEGRFVGAEEYRDRLRRGGFTPQRFEAALRQDLLLAKLNRILAETVHVADAEVEQAYRSEIERAAVRFVQQPSAGLGADYAPAREELAAHLEAHRADFRLPEQRRVAYLLVDTARLREQVTVGDDEVRAYYDQHGDEFTQDEQVEARHILLRVGEDRTAEQARQELAAIRARIEGGEAFAAIATAVSEDPGSAARGGGLGSFGRGRMTPEFEQAAFAAPVGELVGPIETPFGVHLLEVTARRQAGLQPFEEVAPRIRARMLGERVLETAEQKAQELSQTLRAEGDQISVPTLRAAADADAALLFQQIQPFGRDDLIPGIGRSAEFVAAVFGLDPGKLSEPVRVPRGFALAVVEEVLEPRDPALEEVEDRVRQAVEQEHRQQLAMETLGNAAADIAEGRATFDEVAARLGLAVQDSGEFGRGAAIPGLGLQPAIADAAMALAEGEVGGPYGTAQGAVLFQVTARTAWDPEEFAAARAATRERLEQERLGRLLDALIEQRKLELGVNYDADLVEELGLAGPAAPA